MNSTTLDEHFASALRRELVTEARKQSARRLRTLPATLAASLAIGGAVFAVSAATGGPDADLPLAAPIIQTHTGSAVVSLPEAPAGAHYLMVIVTPLSPGAIETPLGGLSGVDATSSGRFTPTPWVDAYPLDATGADPARALPPLDPRQGLPVTAAPGMTWRIYAAYTTSRANDWGLNGSQHVGLPSTADVAGTTGLEGIGIPSLLYVQAANGDTGYVKSDLLVGAHATASNHSLPLLDSNGTTSTGTISIG